MHNYGLKLAWRSFLLALLLVASCFILFAFIHKVQILTSYHNPSIHMETLEDYYQGGQLDLLSDYMQENGLHGDPYRKYWEAVQGFEYFTACSNLSDGVYPLSEAEWQLYQSYQNKLTALYQSCQSENRSLFETFLSLLT